MENRQIARSWRLLHSTVANYLSRAQAAGVNGPLPADLDDVALERELFPAAPIRSEREMALRDSPSIHE